MLVDLVKQVRKIQNQIDQNTRLETYGDNTYASVPIHIDLHKRLKGKLAEIDAQIRLHLDYNGAPHEWQGNEKTVGLCGETCPLSDICIVYNSWLNRPPKRRFDRNGDVIEYDYTGNRKYQIENLITGEQI